MVVDENLATSGSYKLRKLGESQCAAVYSHFFGDDQGSLSDVTHLQVDNSVTPVIYKRYRVPQSVKLQVKTKLQKVTEKEIIFRVLPFGVVAWLLH